MVKHQKRDINDLFRIPVFRFIFKNHLFLNILKLVVSFLFIYALIYGFIHPSKEDNIFTTAVFWSLFWPFFMVISLSSFGRIFCGICPHGFLGRLINKYGLRKKMPKFLQNPLIGVTLLIVGFWVVYYAYPNTYRSPLASSTLFLVMSIAAFSFFFIYDDMAYCKSICPIGSTTRAFSKVSFTWLGTYKETCQKCTTFECNSACSYNLKPFTFDKKVSMDDCTLCMDCANACESISFKVKKPSFSLFHNFKVHKGEIWAIIFITIAITMTMSLHHALGRVSISDQFIWVKTGKALEQLIGIPNIDYIGISAMMYATLSTLIIVFAGMYIASIALKTEFKKVFYSLSYSFIPIFIIGGLSHIGEFFFIHHYSNIINGFAQGFNLDIQPVKPLATMRDGWLKIFSIMNYVAVIWSFIILAGRVNLFKASKIAKTIAFVVASGLIIFYLGLNIYKVYAFKTYGAKPMQHMHHNLSKKQKAKI
ncbi:MAG: 4Fe-4S binding protein [Sulfurospirillaceae bacterium]|nr:4Fe-4S binding protein [Sulfurospirillaceae bacterium]